MLSCKISVFSLLFFFSFILTLALTALLRRICLKRGIFLKENTPYIGGIGFFLPFVLIILMFFLIRGMVAPFQFTWIVIFSFILLAVEFIDDLKDFSLGVKVIVQSIFIFLFLIYAKKVQIYFLPFWANYLISFLWIAGITNAFNHLDVTDGLCGGVSLIIALTFFAVFLKTAGFLAFILAGLCGCLLAFLFFNMPKAKVFMGNSGSHFLGFFFAVMSIYGDYASLDNLAALFFPVLILGIPIIDTFYLIIIRSIRKISPLRKSDDHIFLKYLSKGYAHKKVLAVTYFLALLWSLSALSILRGVSFIFLTFFLAALIGSILAVIRAGFNAASRA